MNIEKTLSNKILNGEQPTLLEYIELSESENLEAILQEANNIRTHFCGNRFELCSIINAKSGKCSEDCSYCAQSVHYKTNADIYSLLSKDEIFKKALYDQSKGVDRFSLVTSGKKSSVKDFNSLLNIISSLKLKTSLKPCASLGILSKQELSELKKSGLTRYHHNLETGPNYFAKVCSTHTFEDRVQTIQNAQAVGLEVCSGGIIGLGESMQDRIEMFMTLQMLQVQSVPINILTAIEGTPLYGQTPLAVDEILRTIAIARFILPSADIRFAGGRDKLGVRQKEALQGGINSALTGDYLTTTGSVIAEDLHLFQNEGFQKKN